MPIETWKTSCFVWIDGASAVNDLTDAKYPLPPVEMEIVSRLKAAPSDHRSLARSLRIDEATAEAVVRGLAGRGLIVPANEDESGRFSINRVDIEIGSHCNARCAFCPVSLDPKPKNIMTMDLFHRVVGQVAPYRPEWIALNNFSEPMLDPYFVERCRAIEEYGLKILLFTNASAARPAAMEYLRGSRVLHSVVINFASDDPQEWSELMGLPAALHARTVENIAAVAEAFPGPISISVNGRNATHQRRTENIARMFARYPHLTVQQFPSNTLGGTISGPLVGPPAVTSAPFLGGCNRLAGHLHVSWRGDVFICCLDYEQKSVFGNIAESSVEEILGGERARRYRRQVYGLEPAAPGLLCRSCCHIRAPLARVAHA